MLPEYLATPLKDEIFIKLFRNQNLPSIEYPDTMKSGACWNGISHHRDIILKCLNTIPLYLNRTPLYLMMRCFSKSSSQHCLYVSNGLCFSMTLIRMYLFRLHNIAICVSSLHIRLLASSFPFIIYLS